MAIPMKITTNQGIAVRSVPDGAPEAYVDEDGILAYLDDVQGVPFVISGLTPAIPVMTVTGSPEVTYFTRSGTDYTQVLWRQSGGFELSGDVANAQYALGAGGGTGGRSKSLNYIGAPGGAGGIIQYAGSIPSGSYTATIGAGGAAITAGTTRNNGSNSVLVRPNGTDTAIGGGGGGVFGTGMAEGASGGSGGGGRAQTNGNGAAVPGSGTSGQGNNGGSGFSSSTATEAASGGSGGANTAGGNASANTPGTRGEGVTLSWTASPTLVCRGQPGLLLANAQSPSSSENYGNGSQGAVNADVGSGGDGFLFIVFPTANANVT